MIPKGQRDASRPPSKNCPACNNPTLTYVGYQIWSQTGRVYYFCSACGWEPHLDTVRMLEELGHVPEPEAVYLLELLNISAG